MRNVLQFGFVIVGVSLCGTSDVLGQQRMLANYAAMPDLRCVGGFLATDGFWTADEKALLTRKQGWVQISAIHDVVPVAGQRPGADEPGYHVNTMYAGVGSPAMQYKVHLLQPPEAFLEFLGRCSGDRGMHSIPRLAPPRNRR